MVSISCELTWKSATTRSATHRLTMNTCIGALCFLLLSSTHSTKLFPRVVRASTNARTVISARARPRSLTLGWGRVWGVVVELFSGKIPKKDPPPWELLREFSSETNKDEEEKLFLPAAAREERANPSQSVSKLMLSIPAGQKPIKCVMFFLIMQWCKNSHQESRCSGSQAVEAFYSEDLINKHFNCSVLYQYQVTWPYLTA